MWKFHNGDLGNRPKADFPYYFCEGSYSLTLEGPADTTITLFASFAHITSWGYIVLRKTDDLKVWVIDLESFKPGIWSHIEPKDKRYGGYDIFYREGWNFERNISSVKWGKWWVGSFPSSNSE